MAVAAFKSTSRRQWDIRGVEIDGKELVPATPRASNTSPTRRSVSRNPSPTRRSMSRNPSPTRRSMSKNPSPTRGRRSTSKAPSPKRRSMSKAPSPTRGRRSMSKAPSPTRGRRSMSKAPSPTRGRRSMSKAPSPTRRRSTSKAPSPTRRAEWRAPSPTRRSITRAASPSSRRRSVSRNPSPQRGRRAASRGPSPNRQRGPPSTSGKTESRPASPSRRLSAGGPRPASPQKSIAKPVGRVHRRAQSFADLSLPQFLADSPVASDSTPIVATRQSGVGVKSSSRTLPSDSESEAEPRYVRRLDRSFSRRDSSDNESIQSSRSAGKRASGVRAGSLRRTSNTQMESRRSLTNLEISDTSTPVYYQKPKPVAAEEHCNAGKDGREVQGEEVKTIQEVHTQTKVHTLCYNCLYDVSATADAPSDSVSPDGGVKIKVLGSSREAPPGDATDFVTMYNTRGADIRRAVSDARVELEQVKEDDLRKVMEQKLELSEKKVSELWSQCASEERKCLHLVKSVKDIKEGLSEAETDELDLEVTLPDADDLKPQQHRYPMDDMDETDFIRHSLNEEAARYFEECVIIANFDANVADDISVSSSRISDGALFDDPRPSRRQSSESSQEVMSVRTKAIKPLDDEGMLLPWLDWEPEVDLGRKERIEKAVGDFREWKSAWARKSVEWGKSSNRERGKDEGAVNVDEFLFERTRLQPRISHGRMLVCGGKR